MTARTWPLAALTLAACAPALCPAPPAPGPSPADAAPRASAGEAASAAASASATASAAASAPGGPGARIVRGVAKPRPDDPKVLQFDPEDQAADAPCGDYMVSQEVERTSFVALRRRGKTEAEFRSSSFASVYAVACGPITGPDRVDLVILQRDHANRDQTASLMIYRLAEGFTFVARLEALITAGIERRPSGGYWFVTMGPELDEAPFRGGQTLAISRLGSFPRVFELKGDRFDEVSGRVPEFYRAARRRDLEGGEESEPCDLEGDCGFFRALRDGAYSSFVGDWPSRRGVYGRSGQSIGDDMAAHLKGWLLRRKRP